MLGQGRIGTFQPLDFELFVGLDTDKRSMSVVILDWEGRVQSTRMAHDAGQLLGYMNRRYSGRRAVYCYEAGPTGFGLHDRLVAAGHSCLVASASMVPSAPGQRVKTNRLDAVKLACALKSGELKSIHVPPMIYRELRHLVSLRDTYVDEIKAFKYRIKGLLLLEGIEFPAANGLWSLKLLNELKQLQCSEAVRFKLDQLIESLMTARSQALKSLRAIRDFCRRQPEINESIGYLMSIPGIGWITASHLVARIGDWRHLHEASQLAGFFGLGPRESSTGDRVVKGSITRTGDGRLRSKLIQCAWAAVGKDPELGEFYRRIHQRQPRQLASRKAIVAVARKLSMRIYAVLKERRPYRLSN